MYNIDARNYVTNLNLCRHSKSCLLMLNFLLSSFIENRGSIRSATQRATHHPNVSPQRHRLTQLIWQEAMFCMYCLNARKPKRPRPRPHNLKTWLDIVPIRMYTMIAVRRTPPCCPVHQCLRSINAMPPAQRNRLVNRPLSEWRSMNDAIDAFVDRFRLPNPTMCDATDPINRFYRLPCMHPPSLPPSLFLLCASSLLKDIE